MELVVGDLVPLQPSQDDRQGQGVDLADGVLVRAHVARRADDDLEALRAVFAQPCHQLQVRPAVGVAQLRLVQRERAVEIEDQPLQRVLPAETSRF
ncbi:MAG: hypothetical protein QM775_32530 [Pirellulales bacterium]